jgi:hypothetical protein
LKTEASVAGVELVGPDKPEFSELIEELRGHKPDEVLLPALPFSVIARNLSSRSVAFLGVRFDMLGSAGKAYSVVHYADSLRYPENADLTPGRARFICAEPVYTGLVLRSESAVDARGPMNLANLRKALRIRASIDSLAFDNGHFTGPDSLGAFERLAGERQSEERLIAAVLTDSSPEQVLTAAMEQSGVRALARRLTDALAAGGKRELESLACRHRYRIPLWR